MTMRSRVRNVFSALALAGACGYLLAGPGTSCSSFIGQSTLTTTDFCFIFDCQNGIFGGTIDPCGAVGTVGSNTQDPLFTDCPD